MEGGASKSPNEVREACRNGAYNGQTSGLSTGYAQANLCILPKKYAFDFLLFCQRNPKPCPLLHVLEPGVFTLRGGTGGDGIDIRKDVPKYRIYREGVLVEEVEDIEQYWQEDFVSFVIGCSFSFEDALMKAGLKIRNIEERKTVPMYLTNIDCKSAGAFNGKMVVSMRPFKPSDVVKAVEITSRYPKVHGVPVHIGNPADIGISDLSKTDFGEAVELKEGELPVFWACGVTPQSIVMNSKPSICITHAPGHMLILDDLNEELAVS